MAWPTPDQYYAALQSPGFSFSDPQISAGTVTCDCRGPKGAAGNFAIVYEFHAGGKHIAVRCFLRGMSERRDRYQHLTNWLNSHPVASYVEFEYQERGILVGGNWYPIVKMGWADGPVLDAFVRDNLHNPSTLLQLADRWRLVVKDLGQAGVAHGDLQHANVIVTSPTQLRLVDYDGAFVPPLKGEKAIEVGHPNYQHPRREGNPSYFDQTLDNFAALVIYLSLRALAVDPALWSFHSGENLILCRRDYEDPYSSQVLERLRQMQSQEVRLLVEQLTTCCQLNPQLVPPLERLLSGTARLPSLPRRPAVAPHAPRQDSPSTRGQVVRTRTTPLTNTSASSLAQRGAMPSAPVTSTQQSASNSARGVQQVPTSQVAPTKTLNAGSTGLPIRTIPGKGHPNVSPTAAVHSRKRRGSRVLIALCTGAVFSWYLVSVLICEYFSFPYMSGAESLHFTLALVGAWVVGGVIVYLGLRRVRVWRQVILILLVAGSVLGLQFLALDPLEPYYSYRWFDVNSSGVVACVKGSPFSLSIWLPDGTRRDLDVNANHGVAWSPDGLRLAYATHQSAGLHIYSVGTDQTVTVPSLSTWRGCSSPTWHPSGQELAFISGRAIYRIPLPDGKPLLLFESDSDISGLDWSPDGKRIALAKDFQGNSEICVLSLISGGVERLTRNDLWDAAPCWSPDGTEIAYVHFVARNGNGIDSRKLGECWNEDIWMMRADGAQQRQLAHDTTEHSGRLWVNESQPVWSSGDQSVYFISIEDYWGIFRVSTGGGTPQLVRQLQKRNPAEPARG